MVAMLADLVPIFGLRLRTPDLELRLPTMAELGDLGAVAEDGVHDPAFMPFFVPWTEFPNPGRGIVLHYLRTLGAWTPRDWHLDMVAYSDGAPVGKQTMSAKDFAVIREVHTGSWMGRRHHGRGLGTQMRAALLALAFDGLGATSARSAAFEDNPSSLRVSEKLGYRPDGIEIYARRGVAARTQRLRLDLADWRAVVRVPVEIEGLEPCLPMFGLEPKA